MADSSNSRPNPAIQLRMRLELALRAGLTFDKAWEVAWNRVKWPHDTAHRREWKRALAWSRADWEKCYQGVLDGEQISALELSAA